MSSKQVVMEVPAPNGTSTRLILESDEAVVASRLAQIRKWRAESNERPPQ